MMADSLIRSLIIEIRKNDGSFVSATETASSIVLSSLHYLQEVKEMLYNLYQKDDFPIKDY